MLEDNKNYFTRVNSDYCGNPRYMIHFLQCEPDAWKDYGIDLSTKYARVCKLMNTIGGRKFNNKQYGGGIVFQPYNIQDTWKHIERVKKEVTK